MYDLTWSSTAAERHETDAQDRAERILGEHKIAVVDRFGGVWLTVAPDEPEGADNGFTIDTDEVTAHRMAALISTEVGHFVNVEDLGGGGE